MVLEKLIKPKLLEKNFLYAITIAIMYSCIGIVLGRFIFGANAGVMSVVFTSLFLIPALRNLLRAEELDEEKETTFSIQHLIQDNKPLIKAYTGIFAGVFITYFLVSSLFPSAGINVFNILREQLALDPSFAGRASFMLGMFWSILANNWLVLLVIFILALLVGDGAIFFVTWNASAWGAIFGYRAFAASQVSETTLLITSLTLLAIVIWHTILEGGAYILAALAGSAISYAVIKRTDELHKYVEYIALAVIAYLAVAFFMRPFDTATRMIVLIPTALIALYYTHYAFTNKKHQQVFVYNYWLLVIAIAVFVLGVLLETFVLANSQTLATIYAQAAMF
ncbi:MAG: stage II sporulation protein M [Candidatus Woesearchaeota archaeon]